MRGPSEHALLGRSRQSRNTRLPLVLAKNGLPKALSGGNQGKIPCTKVEQTRCRCFRIDRKITWGRFCFALVS